MNKIILILFGIGLVSCGVITTDSGVQDNGSQGQLSTVKPEYMSSSVKPTEDFFLFANEKWLKNNPVPSSESRWGSFNELENSNNKKLEAILETAKNSDDKKGSQNQLLGDYYASFINMKKRDEMGMIRLQNELEMVNSISSSEELSNVVAQLHVIGVNCGFRFRVGQDLKNVDKHISYLGQGGIGLPNKDYYLTKEKAEILKKYRFHIYESFKLKGDDQALADEKADLVLEFEKELAKVMLAPAEMRDPEKTYNKISKGQIILDFNQFHFEKYLQGIGSKDFDSLVVSNPDFVKKVGEMTTSVDLNKWKVYLEWKLINHFASHLNSDFVALDFKFYSGVLKGTSEMKPLKELAIEEITDESFGELLGKAFVEDNFSENAQKKVNTMVDNLLIVFKDRINGLEWMSDDTKKEALTKLNSIGRKLGFPTKWENYSSLEFSADDYIQNIKNLALFDHEKNMDKLTKSVDKDKWSMPAHMVNAYYHSLLNEIVFPAGIMQPPFFDENAEDAVNYGTMGMVIGHEFTHGFDDMGSKFAADGTFRNWWTEEDRKLFDARTEVLGATFAGFCPSENECVNPQLTMGENIADLGGLTLAFHAYQLTDEYKKNEIREGFTPAQRFFIAYAQLWKINYTDEELKNRLANDPHSPGMYRVNGPLKNCPEFFETFEVQEGDKMRNPKSKIARIW